MLTLRLFLTAAAFWSLASASLASHSKAIKLIAGEEAVYIGEVLARATNATGNQIIIVKPGDTLTKLSKQFGVGICGIAKASNLTNPNVIFKGETLIIIPPPTAKPDDTSCLPPAAPSATARCVVRGPDGFVVPTTGLTANLTAELLNITLDAFVASNKAVSSGTLLATTNLTSGSIMRVPACPNSQCTITQGTIKSGDIFNTIAAAAGSTTGQTLALNPGIDRLNLIMGQTFMLPN